jgi:hypothetical protein
MWTRTGYSSNLTCEIRGRVKGGLCRSARTGDLQLLEDSTGGSIRILLQLLNMELFWRKQLQHALSQPGPFAASQATQHKHATKMGESLGVGLPAGFVWAPPNPKALVDWPPKMEPLVWGPNRDELEGAPNADVVGAPKALPEKDNVRRWSEQRGQAQKFDKVIL